MMEQWILFPTVLQRKFLLTLLAGIASAGISAIICVATKDHILLSLGIIVLCACLIVFKVLYYRYYNFDLDQPFQPQYEQNNRHLLADLHRIARKQ